MAMSCRVGAAVIRVSAAGQWPSRVPDPGRGSDCLEGLGRDRAPDRPGDSYKMCGWDGGERASEETDPASLKIQFQSKAT